MGERIVVTAAVSVAASVLLTAAVLTGACAPVDRGLIIPTGERPIAKPHAPDAAHTAPAFSSASEYVVAPGLRWLITLRPSRIATHLDGLGATFPNAQQRAAFEHSIGVELDAVADAAIAGFDYSTVYVVQTRRRLNAGRTSPLLRFNARNAGEPLTNDIAGTTLFTGVREELPHHYAQLDALTHLWSEGDPSSIKASILLGGGRLTQTRSALRGASLSLLPGHCRSSDIEVFVPGPIEKSIPASNSAPSAVLDLVLAGFIGFSVDGDTLHVNGCVVGDWGQEGQERVSALLLALQDHRFVSLLALTETEKQAAVQQVDDVVSFTYTWNATRTLFRLRSLLELRLDELIGRPTPAPLTQ